MTQNAEITPRDAEKMRACALEPERLRGCDVREYGFGERVIAEGAPFGSLFVVTGGRAKVCVGASNGKSLVLCFYVSSGLLGEAELFSGSRTGQTTVTALFDNLGKGASGAAVQNMNLMLGFEETEGLNL